MNGVSVWPVELSCLVVGGRGAASGAGLTQRHDDAVTLVFAMRLLEVFRCRYAIKVSKVYKI